MELDTTLRDEGVSGYSGWNRIKGALGSFIQRVEAGEIRPGSYLLVDSMDRFSRENETQVINMLTTLTLNKIKVVNVAEEHVLDETADIGDLLRVLIHASRSFKESEEKSRKLQEVRARERQLARDEKTPATPVGPRWLKLVTGVEGKKVWEPIPEKVAILRRVFDLKEEGLGDQYIAQTFNRENVQTPTGRGRWFNSTVADMSKSIAAIGQYQPHIGHAKGSARQPVGDPIDGFYPVVINPDQFHRVQAIRASRRNPNARPGTKTFPNLLIGLVQCGSCGGVVGLLNSTFPRKPDWKPSGALRCNGVARGLCDNRSRVPYSALEAALIPFIASLPIRGSKPPDHDSSAILSLEGERVALANKIESLLDQLEGGAAVVDRIRQREREMAEVDARLGKLKTKANRARAAVPTRKALNAIAALNRDMANATGAALYAIRARINSKLRQVINGGFIMDRNGTIVVRLHPDQALAKMNLLADTAQGSRLRWEISNLPWDMPLPPRNRGLWLEYLEDREKRPL